MSISGSVWADIDGNGQWTSNEWPLPNVLIVLLSAEDPTFYKWTYTSLSGQYAFYGLAAGAYQVQQVQPETFISGTAMLGQLVNGNSSEVQGLGMVANAGYVLDCNTICGLVLPPGYQATDYNFTLLGLDFTTASKRLFTWTPPVVPEPGAVSLLAVAALVVGAGTWRRRRFA